MYYLYKGNTIQKPLNLKTLRFSETAVCIIKIFGLNFHDELLETVVLACGAVFYASLVGIHRVNRIIQEVGDALTVGDAQSDECEYTHLAGQRLVVVR